VGVLQPLLPLRGALTEGLPSSAPAEEAIRRLYDEHWVGLCRLAALILGDRAAGEEMVQEAFTRTFARWDRVQGYERLDAYVRSAVVNLCRSRIRRRVVERRVNASSYTRDETWERARRADADQGPEPDDTARVMAAVRRLPPRQRAAVVLRYYEDMSDTEIGAALGCSPGTVKSQLSKGRNHLARLLGPARQEREAP
jgi:RNA polymerase sigma-70 factor (sigma-E family)